MLSQPVNRANFTAMYWLMGTNGEVVIDGKDLICKAH
ncbi:Uncharacterised protein [Vibrio cholerae]|nr:Uncharacterised protein [Vibrio cholerae]